MPSIAFAKFWQVDLTRECLLSCLDQADLQTLRLVSKGIATTIAPVLFEHVAVNFDATCFARQARMSALHRVGPFVKTFTFSMPHTDDTFLPPLIDPETLDEISFLYEPQNALSSTDAGPASKYGSWELNDLLVRQYPLLYHAATNIPSFVRAIEAMPSLRHLRITCPNQSQQQTLRRDIVDYALLSLRIAVEQVNPRLLETLSLDPIHPSATYYLRSHTSIGTSPASSRVWRRIKTLNMVVESPEIEYAHPASVKDDLKLLHTYLATFTAMENFQFTWVGSKGPSPLSLDSEPCTTGPSSLDYTYPSALSSTPPSLSSSPSSTRSSASSYFEPFPARKITSSSPLRRLNLTKLKSMRLCNSTLDASQAAQFIHSHRKTLVEFQFESCQLRTGTWDDALAPLTRMSRSDSWKEKQYRTHGTHKNDNQTQYQTPSLLQQPPQPYQHPSLQTQPSITLPMKVNEILEVPLILSPCDERSELELLVRERMWAPDITLSAFHDDTCNLQSFGERHRGMKALRRFGEKLGLAKKQEQIEAAEGVRKLLRLKIPT